MEACIMDDVAMTLWSPSPALLEGFSFSIFDFRFESFKSRQVFFYSVFHFQFCFRPCLHFLVFNIIHFIHEEDDLDWVPREH